MILFGNFLFYQADSADTFIFDQDIHAWNKPGAVFRKLANGLWQLQKGQQIFHQALYVCIAQICFLVCRARLLAQSIKQQAKKGCFPRCGFGFGILDKSICGFKNLETLRALGKIVAQIVQKSWRKGSAQHILFAGKRIEN